MLNIDLLPNETKEKLRREKQVSTVFYVSLCVVIIFIMSSFYLKHVNNILKTTSTNNQNIVTENQQTLAKFSALQKDIIFLNDRFVLTQTINNSQTPWSTNLQDITDAATNNTQIISLDIDLSNDPNFIVRVAPTSNQNLISLRQNLEKSSMFKNMVIKNNMISFNLAR